MALAPDPASGSLTRRHALALAGGALLSGCVTTGAPGVVRKTWTFDRLTSIGGVGTTVEGAPTLVDSPWGRAVQFDGVDDALFIAEHPLAGAATFTFEALFRPDGGAFEQRWMHLQADDVPGQAADAAATRFLFEIRVVRDRWYLDAFTRGAGYNHTLIFPQKLFPVGQWHHVAQSFDGTTYRAYVNGALQGEAVVPFKAQGPGRSSVGCRINRVNHFKGAVREARFTHAFLPPERFANPFA